MRHELITDLMIAAFSFLVGAIIAADIANIRWQNWAIEHGYAYYHAETGELILEPREE